MAITGIILAGGKSGRFGQDKTSATIDGESLIQRVLCRLVPLSSEIIIVTSQQDTLSLSIDSSARTVPALYPEKGPLGGIYTGLVASVSSYNLVVACDMPFLNIALLKYMIHVSSDFDLVVPKMEDKVEPLHAIYSKYCLSPIEHLIQKGEFKISSFFDTVRVRYIKDNEINKFDPEHLSFFNVNSIADLEKARILARQKQIELN